LDRQHFPPSLHVTVNYVHAQVAAEFLSDLENAVGVVNRPGLRKTATKFLVKAANLLTRILPEQTVSNLFNKASSLLGGGGGLPTRMAPMYGLIGSLPNRGDLKELVLDLLDGINTYKK